MSRDMMQIRSNEPDDASYDEMASRLPSPVSTTGPMPKNHSYVLGINAYDHDVSACLLRDGEIAYGIEKERITRQKHAGGFFQEVVDYCLRAEGITVDELAHHFGTIGYEVLTNLGRRYARVYKGGPGSSEPTAASP